MLTKRAMPFSLAGSGFVCLLLGCMSVCQGQAVPRVFVSTNGSDLNPCSAVQPCRSFNQALTQVEAGGEIVVQNSGGYSTGFTITQGVTIDAAGFNASVISINNTDLCTINAAPTDRVVLRGISFHGASMGSNGINVTQVGSLYVEHCSIGEFTNCGVNMPNGGSLFVTGTDVRGCGNAGVLAFTTGALAVSLEAHDSRFMECNIGVVLQTAGTGPAMGLLSDCTASVGGTGFNAQSSGAGNTNMTLTNCRASGNVAGVVAETSSTGAVTIGITNCVVTQNRNNGLTTLKLGAGIPTIVGTSPGSNDISGNGTNGTVNSSVTLQ